MYLKEEDVLKILEALVLSEYYTGDNKFKKVLEKIQEMQKEYEEQEKRKKRF